MHYKDMKLSVVFSGSWGFWS